MPQEEIGLRDLLVERLQELLSAENQLAVAVPNLLMP